MNYTVENIVLRLYLCLCVEGAEVVERDRATLRGKILN